MIIGTLPPVSESLYGSLLKEVLPKSISAGSSDFVNLFDLGVGLSNAKAGAGVGDIVSLSFTQNANLAFISEIANKPSFIPQLYSSRGIALPMWGVRGLLGLGMPVVGGGNPLALGVESLLGAFITMPEISIPKEKVQASQEINYVRPSTGYNPYATTEEMMAETYALIEESRALIGGTVDIVA